MRKMMASGINMRKSDAKDFEMNSQEKKLQYSGGSETEPQCAN